MWMDKKKVCMMSTYHDDEMFLVPDRSKGDGVTKWKPIACRDYKKVMPGVDLNDQLRSAYDIARKRNKRYYKKMYHTVLDMSILNSWIVYNQLVDEDKKLSFLIYKVNLIKQLVRKYGSIYQYTNAGPSRITHKSDHRLQPGSHFPKRIGMMVNGKDWKRRDCIVCKKTDSSST